MKYFSLLFALVWAYTIPTFSQVSNDNEDGVYKVDACLSRTDYREGEVLVKFKSGSAVQVKRCANGKFMSSGVNSVDALFNQLSVEEVEELMPRTGAKMSQRRVKSFTGTEVKDCNLGKLYRVKFDASKELSVFEAIDRLKSFSEVEYAEPNYKVYIMADADDYTAEPLYSQQWGLPAINMPQMWGVEKITQKRPVIAILDTGVDITHPDLADNIWTNTIEAEGEEGYDNDNNGLKNDIHGWDFINQTGNIRDFNGHGTHCAGIAAAIGNNGVGVVGANPDALIMPITVMQSDGTGDIATIIKGIDYAKAKGADIISMSFGTYATSSAFQEALGKAYQTAILVAATGNDGWCLNHVHLERGQIKPMPMFPAAYNFVLGVQASASSGNLTSFTNYDDNGPFFSSYGEEQLYNYELRVPGANILSTWPNGNYKRLNGTSMACPLVAGALSQLIQCKEMGSKEELFGDLIHSVTTVGDLDIYKAYQMSNDNRQPSLSFVTYTIDDSEGDGDGIPDAGETIAIYPTLRNSWGRARNIRLSIELGELEDENILEFLNNNVDFGSELSSYAMNRTTVPLRLKINENCADGRHIKLTLKATCDNILEEFRQEMVLIANNVVELGGIIAEDMTLTADKNYVVISNLGIPENVTLTIEPGTRLRFVGSISSQGNLIAEGTPGSPIVFEGYNGGDWEAIRSQDTLKYCIFKNCRIENGVAVAPMVDCVLQYCKGYRDFADIRLFSSNLFTSSGIGSYNNNYCPTGDCSNYVNNGFCGVYRWSGLKQCNFFNNSNVGFSYLYKVGFHSRTPSVDRSTTPSYLGSSEESIVRNYIYDINNGCEFGSVDLSNMRTEPVAEAHGIVWKVVVDGYDAQDEYEEMPPLGVGSHVFQVYFNRPMNKEKAPQISFGVREPYTQVPVNLNGRWSSDGKIYTAFVKITGKTSSDGYNTIYVYGAEDNEFFEIPYEKTRFHINVQSAGSLATGFAAEAGMGKVNLTWNNDENDFDDAMGFNIYRYTIDEAEKADTIRINDEIVDIETTAYTDYDVVPGTTYYYLYRVLSTDLKEFDVSNVVAVTPLTSTKGDANGSGDVDVADVITTVNYAAGQQPKPFIFEAADMNEDLSIDILDVIGIIKQIMNPNAEAKASVAAVASYTIEDGVVYVDSPVDIAGVQIQLSLSKKLKENNEKLISVAEDMKGFEHTSAWLSDNDYLFLGYNMNGKTLTAGKHAILIIGDAQIADIRLSDRNGHNIIAESTTVDKIDRMARDVMTINGIYDLQGRKISGNASDLQKLPKGVYIINGVKVVR